jgi:hypothetical protein
MKNSKFTFSLSVNPSSHTGLRVFMIPRKQIFHWVPHFRSLQETPSETVITMTPILAKATHAAITKVKDLRAKWCRTSEELNLGELDLQKCTMFGT